MFIVGQFYAISFEGNVSPPSADGEIERVRVSILVRVRGKKYPIPGGCLI